MKRIFALILFSLCAALALPATALANSTNDADHLSLADRYPERYEAMRQARMRHIEALRAYRDAGAFPDTRNTDFMGQGLTVFLDPMGVPCAFAAVMIADGQMVLVQDVANNRNHLLVGDVHDGDFVMDWILASGLTHEESIVIQEPGFVYEQEPIDKNTLIRASLDQKLMQLEANTEASLEIALARAIEADAKNARAKLAPFFGMMVGLQQRVVSERFAALAQ